MLKQVVRTLIPKRNTIIHQNDIRLLCNRVGYLNLSPRLFTTATTTATPATPATPPATPPATNGNTLQDPHRDLSPSELLRKEAQKVEIASSLRPRCLWLKEEDEKLLRLVKEVGKRWTFISKHFVDRPPSTLMNRYSLLIDGKGRGPWTEEEVKKLRELGKNRSPDDIDNWEEIQSKLPVRRPLFLIRQKYIYSLNPSTKFGHWTQEESDKLEQLITKYGEKNISLVAQLMGSRTKRQCLERWRWQMASMKKGRFSFEEDVQIIEAVKKYGENFAVVAKVIGSERTARHISQHYRNMLAPDIDRSPWTMEEQLQLYKTCLENNGNMITTKKVLGSKRAIRDMWNHFITQKKLNEVNKK